MPTVTPKTTSELSRWELARILSGAIVTIPVGRPYMRHEIDSRRDVAFLTLLQLEPERLRGLMAEFMESEGLPPETKWMPPDSIGGWYAQKG